MADAWYPGSVYISDDNPSFKRIWPNYKAYEGSQEPTTFLKLGRVKVRVISCEEQLEDGIDELRNSPDDVFALDLEWNPDRRRGSNNAVAVITVANGYVCLVIQTDWMYDYRYGRWLLPQALHDFFTDPSPTWITWGWAGSDRQKMSSTFDFETSELGYMIDAQVCMRRSGNTDLLGLSNAANHFLGVDLPRRGGFDRHSSLGEWSNDELTEEQVAYAAMDVICTLSIFKILNRP